jgi:type VI secretion system secreted protein VgrG
VAVTQAGRRLLVKTPLGTDVLILNGFTGHEAISRPFSFQLQCIAENSKKVPFEGLLGQKVTIEVSLPGGDKRWINGVCLRVAQGGRDENFTAYVLDLVPSVALLAKKTQSRIFQHKKIPDILKEVLAGLDVKWEIQGTFEPRDSCVQYRESDFAFASRLMEEEGIYYFFKHADGSHTMVVTNQSQPDISPGKSNLIFEGVVGGTREEDRVHAWEKMQELRSGKVTLWDHCFELPHKHLEASDTIMPNVAAGKSAHKLQLAANAPLELYDFPGAYAQRFDGINKGGGEQPAEIQKIFQDNSRTTKLRMQAEAAASVLVHGASNCRQLVSGHKFTLERHFEGDGAWVLYEVDHLATESADVRSGRGGFTYQNHFSCFPAALPFRPPRVTPIPTVRGTQTAVVVGPSGEEIFTDKYGRIKVQFHWDREGKKDSDSSCWVRVATHWAGHQWGAIHIPRIGQEVVVDFLEGDMDQPIVVGSVYNAECMPPYALPANKTQSGIKSRSSLGGNAANYNEIRFEDKKGHEQLLIHAEKNQDIEVEVDESHSVGHDRSKTIGHDETTKVGRDRTETVARNEMITIGLNRTETVTSNESITIGVNRTEMVGANEVVTIGAARTETIGAADVLTVGGARVVTVGGAEAVTVGGALAVTAGSETTVTVGGASLTMKKDGSIEIKGKDIKVTGSASVKVSAPKVEINGDASVDIGSNGPVTIKGNPIKLNC